jgi:hypothetical protein
MIFYVYEHWRLDTDTCFYVGKGKEGRAYSRRSRNAHWKNIVCKLERLGSGYEIRLVATGLTEEEAFRIEIERISFWMDKVDLANITNGGEGFSGGRHTEESKKKISIGSKKTALDNREKNRLRMLGGQNPFYGKSHSQETIDKIKKKLTGRKIENPRPKSEEHKSSISATMKTKGIKPPSREGSSPTEEDRKKKSDSLKKYYENNPKPSAPRSEEAKRKTSESLKAYWASKKEIL